MNVMMDDMTSCLADSMTNVIMNDITKFEMDVILSVVTNVMMNAMIQHVRHTQLIFSLISL